MMVNCWPKLWQPHAWMSILILPTRILKGGEQPHTRVSHQHLRRLVEQLQVHHWLSLRLHRQRQDCLDGWEFRTARLSLPQGMPGTAWRGCNICYSHGARNQRWAQRGNVLQRMNAAFTGCSSHRFTKASIVYIADEIRTESGACAAYEGISGRDQVCHQRSLHIDPEIGQQIDKILQN